MPEIIPAILTNDIADFRKKYAELLPLSHHFKKLHVDFLDNDFLPGDTLDMSDFKGFVSHLQMVAHLMVVNPKDYFAEAKNVGFYCVVFHFEVFEHQEDIDETINLARKLGLKVGIAIDPETDLYEMAKFIPKVDVVEILTVNPGAQGRQFLPECLNKVRELKKLTPKKIAAVDGGVSPANIRDCLESGADWLIVGSTLWKSTNLNATVNALKAEFDKP
jgi:ribulose-phosphate 3-epimerase